MSKTKVFEQLNRLKAPDYEKLKCPKCGNTTNFIEFALRDTKQPFIVGKDGTINWDSSDTLDDSWPTEIWCGVCEDTWVVWKA